MRRRFPHADDASDLTAVSLHHGFSVDYEQNDYPTRIPDRLPTVSSRM